MAKQTDKTIRRREFVKLAGTGVLLAPLVSVIGCADKRADTPPAPAAAKPAPKPAAPAAPPAASEPPAAAAPPAAGMEKLSEDDPLSQSLGYKHNAADVDLAKFPRRGTPEAANEYCKNCALYQGGDAEWGGCAIFGTRQVNAEGWCASYAPMS